jgi:hypothetical protein
MSPRPCSMTFLFYLWEYRDQQPGLRDYITIYYCSSSVSLAERHPNSHRHSEESTVYFIIVDSLIFRSQKLRLAGPPPVTYVD